MEQDIEKQVDKQKELIFVFEVQMDGLDEKMTDFYNKAKDAYKRGIRLVKDMVRTLVIMAVAVVLSVLCNAVIHKGFIDFVGFVICICICLLCLARMAFIVSGLSKAGKQLDIMVGEMVDIDNLMLKHYRESNQSMSYVMYRAGKIEDLKKLLDTNKYAFIKYAEQEIQAKGFDDPMSHISEENEHKTFNIIA